MIIVILRYLMMCATGADREPCKFGLTWLSKQRHDTKTACSGHEIVLMLIVSALLGCCLSH